jgi:hypothetical protein
MLAAPLALLEARMSVEARVLPEAQAEVQAPAAQNRRFAVSK